MCTCLSQQSPLAAAFSAPSPQLSSEWTAPLPPTEL